MEKNFKNIIISHVKDKEMSISQLSRDLQGDGYKIHRLYLTGYLKALADLGILREKEIPPSKVYTTSANLDKNIYESIGDRCKDLKLQDGENIRVAAFILQRLFKRPIFLSEIKNCRLDGAVIGTRAPSDERADLRDRLVKAGLKIPGSDPAYVMEDAYENEFDDVISSLVIEKFDAMPLIIETKQAKLDDVPKTPKVKRSKRKARKRK